jgi:prepilin-type processing-associated H-X9-DG protein/prepilin-type N-terminal cleavage/methylation domain-containing protein
MHKSERREPTGRTVSAFTLVELLVVVALIAILTSLLLPALGRAKLTAQCVRCQANLKQLQLAWQAYGDDHNECMVANWVRGTQNPTSYIDAYSTSNSWICGSARKSDTPDGIRQGALWCYLACDGLYHCPADKTLWPYGSRLALRPFNVALNCCLNGGWDGGDGKRMDPLVMERHTEVRRPAALITFLDEDASSMTSGTFFVITDQDRPGWFMVPGVRDRGSGANVAFADGHVAFHKWRFPGRTWKGGWGQDVENADDRADWVWLISMVSDAGIR